MEAHDWARLPEAFHRGIGRDYVVLVEQDRSLPVAWPEKRIEEIAEKVAMGPFGSSIRVNTFVPEGIPIISGQHLHGVRVDDRPGFNFITEEHADRLKSANVQRGDIILTHRGTIGQVSYVPRNSVYDRYVASQSQFYLRCDRRQVIPQFVAYYLKTHEGQHKLLANTSQVGVPSIAQPVSYLRSISIPVPPLDEQRAIVHVLDTLDDKIALNRRMNDTLEAMVRALFKSWFIDFDPVRAKQEGRDAGLPKHLADLFPDRIIDAGSDIPLGWTHGRLRNIAYLNPESWSTKKHPATLSYVDLTHVKRGVVDRIENIAWNDGPSRARRVLRRHDTIMATVRPGNGSFALIGQDGLTGSTGFAVLRPMKERDRALVWCTVTSQKNIERLSHIADGAAYPAVRPKDIVSTPLVLAAPAVREEFSAIVDPLLDRAETNAKECRNLCALRDTIVTALISRQSYSAKRRLGDT